MGLADDGDAFAIPDSWELPALEPSVYDAEALILEEDVYIGMISSHLRWPVVDTHRLCRFQRRNPLTRSTRLRE